MNPFVLKLSEGKISKSPQKSPEKFVIEDNIGENIHIHYRNTRFEMTIEEYRNFATSVIEAKEEIEKWE